MQPNEIPAAKINSTLGFRYLMEYDQPTEKFQSSGITSHVQTRLHLGLGTVNMLCTKKNEYTQKVKQQNRQSNTSLSTENQLINLQFTSLITH